MDHKTGGTLWHHRFTAIKPNSCDTSPACMLHAPSSRMRNYIQTPAYPRLSAALWLTAITIFINRMRYRHLHSWFGRCANHGDCVFCDCVFVFVILVWIVKDSYFQNDINDEYSSANSTTYCWRRSTSSRIFDENSRYKLAKVSVMCVGHQGTYREGVRV